MRWQAFKLALADDQENARGLNGSNRRRPASRGTLPAHMRFKLQKKGLRTAAWQTCISRLNKRKFDASLVAQRFSVSLLQDRLTAERASGECEDSRTEG